MLAYGATALDIAREGTFHLEGGIVFDRDRAWPGRFGAPVGRFAYGTSVAGDRAFDRGRAYRRSS